MEKMGMNINAVTAGLPQFMSRPNRSAKEDAHVIEKPVLKNSAVAPGGHDLIEDKKGKRVIALRRYAGTYSQKKIRQRAKLEAEVKAFQAQIEITDPRMKYFDIEKSLLQVENALLKHKLSDYMGELSSKKAMYAGLKQERENMKQLYAYQQQMQQNNQNINFPSGSA